MPRCDDDPRELPQTLVSDRPMSENLTGDWRTLKPVIDGAKCTGCLLCWKFCPEGCVQLTEKVPGIDYGYCKGCGICVVECPTRCIRFDPEAEG